jgi:drug/metabolite transporter (DMT)-like permease
MMATAAVCWSSGGILVRLLSITDPWAILFWRALFLACFMSSLLLVLHGRAAFNVVRTVGCPGILSGCLFAGASICFLGALSHTTVTNTYVLMSVTPFVAAVAAWLILRERIPPITWLAMVVAATGVVRVFWNSLGERSLIGDLLALGVCCCFAGQITTLRRFGRTVDMLPQVLIGSLVAMAVGAMMCRHLAVEGGDLMILAVLGCVQLGVGSSMSTRASRHLSASEFGLIALLEPIFGPVWVWIFHGERPVAAAVQGGLVVIVGVGANQYWRSRSLGQLRSGGSAFRE